MDAPLVEQKPTRPVQTNPPMSNSIQLIISNDKADGRPGNPSHYTAQLPTDGKLYSFAFAQGGSPALFPNAQFPTASKVVATSITFNDRNYVLGVAGDDANSVPPSDGGIPAGPPFKVHREGNAIDISKWTVMANPKS